MPYSIVIIVIFLLLSSGILMAQDYTPSYKTWCAGNIYSSEQLSNANAEWYATHYDFILNGTYDVADTLRRVNSNVKLAAYTNLHMVGNRNTTFPYNGWEYRAIMRHYDSAGIPAESVFTHFSDSVVVATLADGAGRWINVDSLNTAGADSCTRVSLRGWYNTATSSYYPAGDGDWLCNINSPTYRTLRAVSQQFIYVNQDSIWPNDSIMDYIYCDNWIHTYNPAQLQYWLTGSNTKIDSSINYAGAWSTATTSVDWVEQTAIQTNQYTFFGQAMIDILGEVQDSLEAVGSSGCIPNVTSTSLSGLYALVGQAQPGALLFEYRGDEIVVNPYSTGWHNCVLKIDTVLAADPTQKQLWEFRCANYSDTTTANADRAFMISLTAFLCMQDTATCYFKWGRMDRDYWFSGHEVDIGEAVGNYDSSIFGGTDIVIWRRYKKGFVVFRPKMSTDSDTTSLGAVKLYHDSLGVGDTTLYQIDAHLDTLVTVPLGDSLEIKAQDGTVLLFDAGAGPASGKSVRGRIRK